MGLGGFLKSVLPVAASFIPGVGPIAGAAVGAAMSGIGNQNQAGKLNKQAQGIAMGNWKDTAPLRSKALQMALAPRPQREDLSALFADPGNPYSRVVPRPAPSADLSRVAPSAPAAPPGRPVPFFGGKSGVLSGLANRAQGGGGGVGMLQRALAAKRNGGMIGPDGLVRQPGGEL